MKKIKIFQIKFLNYINLKKKKITYIMNADWKKKSKKKNNPENKL